MSRTNCHRLVWLIPVVAVVIALIAPLSFTVTDRVHMAWWNFLHVPAFAFIVAVSLSLAPRRWMAIGCIAMVLVPVVERVQDYTGREFSHADMYLGWIGVGIGLLWWLRSKLQIKARMMVPVLGLLAVGLWHPLAVMVDRRNVQRAFPVLVGFDNGWVPSRWQIAGCTVEIHDGEWFARLTSDGGYPGMFLADLPPDWSRAERWEIDVEVTGVDHAEMWVRLDDRLNPAYYDRFQEVYRLTSRVHRIEIPREQFERATGGRTMELHRVQTAGIFFSHATRGMTFRIHRMELKLYDP